LFIRADTESTTRTSTSDDAAGESFDGRNIGVHVTFNPGGIDINDPYPAKTPQQIHTSSLRHRSARSLLWTTPSHAVLQYPRWAFSGRSGQSGVFSATGVHTLDQGAAQLQRQRRSGLQHTDACRAGPGSQLCSASPRPFANSSRSSVDKTAITSLTTRSSLPYKIHEQAILAQFVLYPLQGE